MSGIVEEGPDKLLRLDLQRPSPSYRTGVSSGYTDDPVRGALREIFSPDGIYTFMRTSANPEADRKLRRNADRIRKERGITHHDFDVYFSADLMDVYLHAIGAVARTSLGNKNYASYPLVESRGVLLGGPGKSFWPVVHVVRNDPSKTGDHSSLFRAIVNNNMTSKGVLHHVIAEQEAPQNYRMPYVRLLLEEGINPLVLHERTWRVSGRELRDAIDFLTTKEYFEESTRSSIDSD